MRRNKTRLKHLLVEKQAAFTLVEMLISVALVLLMMTLFAQVFQMAGSSISTQRGLAENDQRSRMLQTIIKADLDNRTFSKVMPFAPNESVTEGPQGYFYISENSTLSGVDDVLQFTVATTSTDPYYGKALTFPSIDTATPPDIDLTVNPFNKYPHQPDVDDSQTVPNNTGSSTRAEVVYFVRNGNLYRRQLLVRKLPPIPGIKTQPDSGSGSNTGADLFTSPMAPSYDYLLGKGYATSFWNDFDYSASFGGSGALFLGEDALKNDGSSSIGALANPKYRFGHDYNSGNPKEFLTYSGTATSFIGRYTLEECSNSGFQYPQSVSPTYPNPMAPLFPAVAGSYDIAVDGAVSGYRGGLRRGEDLLLSNVHAFDVQVLDEAAGQFVNLTGATASDYSSSSRQNALYGPNPSANAVFDTWHPKLDLDGDLIADKPPFYPQINTPGASATVTYWTASKPYGVGDKVFPSSANGVAPYYYQCTGPAGGGMSGTNQPNWPSSLGTIVMDNGLVWLTMENRKPLKAIKIEIRFLDTSTQQMRQLTLINSLTN